MPRRNLNASQSRTNRRPRRTIRVLGPTGKWEEVTIVHETRWDYLVQDNQGDRFYAFKPEAVHRRG